MIFMYKLLLVTDKADIQDLYRNYAEWAMQGFETPSIASSAEKGIELLSGHHYDVVSWLLPVEEGRAFYDCAKAYGETVGMETVRDGARLHREIARVRRELITIRSRNEGEEEEKEASSALEEDFLQSLLRGDLPEQSWSREMLDALERTASFRLSSPLAIASFRIPEGEQFLSGVWKYGRGRLDNALRNIFGASSESARFSLLILNPHHMRLLAIATGQASEMEVYAAALERLSTARRVLRRYFDMSLLLKRVNSYTDLNACLRESELRLTH